jgi:hypothetical protein
VYRGAGTGLIGLGVVMGVIGAILKYAVSVDTTGFNINTIGLILLIAGIALFVIGVVVLALGSSRRSYSREDIHQTPTGQSRVEETRDDLA